MVKSPDVPAWLQRFARENNQKYLKPMVDVDDFGNHAVLRFDQEASSNMATISLAAVPPREKLEIILHSAARWELADLDRDSQLAVVVRPVARAGGMKLHLFSSIEGQVRADLGSETTVTVEEGYSGNFQLDSGTLVAGPDELGGLDVDVAGGVLGGGAFRTVRLIGSAELAPVSNHSMSFGRLRIDGDRTLQIPKNMPGTRILIVESSGGRSSVRFTLPPAQRENPREPTMMLNIATFENLTVGADAPILLTVQKSAFNVAFRGPMDVDFGGEAIGDKIHFEEADGVPRLGAKEGAVIDRASGDLVLAGIEGAQLSGGDQSFTIRDVRARSRRSGAPVTDGLCAGAFLSGFRVPRGLRGRSLLNHLDDAHHVEPATDRLPGWDLRLTRFLRPKGDSPFAESTGSALRHDAELMRKLHELTRSKGASGSVRTKVGWCAQVLRHKTTSGRIEKTALWGYRALGYGERPGPPALTWLILSLVFAALLAWLEPCSVEGGILQLWIERAVSPVGAVVGSGAGTETNAWLYLIRAVVAIPLVVAALALRKYVQSGSSPR